MTPIQISTHYFSKFIFNIILQSTPRAPKLSILFRFLNKNFVDSFFTLFMRTTCAFQLILIELITVTKCWANGQDARCPRVRFSEGDGNFSLYHRVQKGSGALTASYPMGKRGSFLGGNAAVSWTWPFTSIYCWGQRISGALPPLA